MDEREPRTLKPKGDLPYELWLSVNGQPAKLMGWYGGKREAKNMARTLTGLKGLHATVSWTDPKTGDREDFDPVLEKRTYPPTEID